MLHKLSVKRPVAVTMIVLIFVVLGLYSVSMLPMELTPEMDLSMAIVYTSYSNVGSQEVENLVTKPIEGAIGSVSGIDTIRSQSSEGTSMIMAQFSTGTDMDQAVQSMKDNIEMVSAYLPEGAEDPMVVKMDMSMMPAAMMNVTYEGYDLIQTKQFVDDNLKDKLESVDGVASVSITGAQDRVIEVTVDPEKLFGEGVNFNTIVGSIAAQNSDMPAGTTESRNKNMSVRTVGKLTSVEDLEVLPITTPTGQTIFLRDIASVKDTFSDSTTYSRLNGESSVSIAITAESDANTVDVVNGVMEVLGKTEENFPKFSYNVTMEQASYIEDAIGSVAQNAIIGCTLAILILLLFLGSIKNSLVIGISMPISVVTTFVGMYFSGMSLNVVSLGGLALGVGMLVDNAVVVIENIFRRRKDLKEDAKTSAILGAGEVVGAVIASVLTTCIVYVPIMFVDNMMAVMFKQLAFAIIFSQVASLITTFLIIPMLASKIDNVEKTNKKLGFILNPFNKFMDKTYVVYEKALRWVLKKRKRFVLGTIAVFIISLIVLSQLGMTLMATGDEGTLSVTVDMPEGTKLEDTDAMSKRVEEIIRQNKNVENVSSSVGAANMLSTSSSTSTITVTLKENRKGTTSDIAEDIRMSLTNVPGAQISVDASSSAMSMSSEEVQFQFSSNDDKKLEAFVLEAEKILAGIDGVTETETSISDTKSEVRIHTDKAKAASYGLTSATVASTVKNALDGMTASRFTESGSEYDIVVTYPDDYVEDYSKLLTIQLDTPIGQRITLNDIADVSVEQGYTTLTRINQKRVVTLTGKLYGTDMGKAKSAFEEKIKKIDMPEGVTMETGGTYEVMMDAMVSLLTAILLGILLMYMVMAAQFESLSQPLIILGTLPLSMIGVVLSLVIAQSPLSVVSCIGILMLIGIVVNNAILLIEFINQLTKDDPLRSRTEIIVEACKTRLRPILMTTLTSVLGFLPMAVSTASGSEMMQPLAVVLLGGLSVGTLLTLLFIPALYTWFDDKHIKRLKKKEARKAKKADKTEKAVEA